MRILKYFAFYSAVLTVVLAIAGVAVHVLMAREYRLNAAERLTIIAHDGEEAVERSGQGAALEPELHRVLGAPNEGLAWLDGRGRTLAETGVPATQPAIVQRLRVDDDNAHGWIVATISNDRVALALRQLDLGLLLGIAVAVVVGGLIITGVSMRAVARVESALERVHRFTGDAAHELRTPLAVIAGNASDLAFGGDEAGRERSLANIRHAARQMRDLMNGLLILARAGEDVTLDLHVIDLGACVEDVAASYRVEAAARELRLNVTRLEHPALYGRPEQVTRIVANLVENALRYTPAHGSIDIACRTERRTAIVEVADSGVGIATENLERVFDRFWRAPGARPGEGSGLGLAIARSLARGHGGDVSVRSRIGAGSTFTIRLPLSPPRISVLSTSS